ncbi:MAG: DUF4097 family beta strand repeat protein [Clostridia bacterium]|nr:DUF4097 family beta strand repeat protein [Clostridia bacterium]
MKKAIVISLIVAGALVLVGAGLFAGAMSAAEWDFGTLQTTKYEPVTYEVTEDFSNISIQTIESSIEFRTALDGKCKVECMESEYVTYSVSVHEGTLKITTQDTRQWYHNIGIFNTQRQNMIVYLPKTAYDALLMKSNTGTVTVSSEFSFANVQIGMNTGAVKWEAGVAHSMSVETDTGFVRIKNVSMDGALSVKTDTGRAEINGTEAKSIQVETDTGKAIVTDAVAKSTLNVTTNTGNAELSGCRAVDIFVDTDTGKAKLTDVVASGKMDVNTDTGDVVLDGCDAAEIKIETDTGDVKGSFLTPKIIYTQTNTGRVEVPRATSGGVCEITTDTGDIQIEFE